MSDIERAAPRQIWPCGEVMCPTHGTRLFTVPSHNDLVCFAGHRVSTEERRRAVGLIQPDLTDYEERALYETDKR